MDGEEGRLGCWNAMRKGARCAVVDEEDLVACLTCSSGYLGHDACSAATFMPAMGSSYIRVTTAAAKIHQRRDESSLPARLLSGGL